MERASGVFKRWSRWLLIVVAAVIVVAFNVDTTEIGAALWESEEARAPAIAAAEALVAEAADSGDPLTAQEAVREVGTLPVPIGWDEPFCTKTAPDTCTIWDNTSGFFIVLWDHGPGHALGWIITILLVSLGAPFWYDALSRLVAIRGSGGKPAKAGDESASATTVFRDDKQRTLNKTLSDPLPSLAEALTPGRPDDPESAGAPVPSGAEGDGGSN